MTSLNHTYVSFSARGFVGFAQKSIPNNHTTQENDDGSTAISIDTG